MRLLHFSLSIDNFKFMHPSNIDFISLSLRFVVSKYGSDKEVKEEQELNIETKVFTFVVLKLDISKCVNAEQLLNV